MIHVRVPLTALFLLSASLLSARQFTGRVTDPSGAVLTKATITALNVDTNVVTRTATTRSGDYTIPYLKVGNYTLSVEAKGFETAVHTGINLQVDQTATVDFAMKVGSSSETVTVNSDPLIDFGKGDAGEVVENTRVAELPLNGRDPGMLSILSAGVTWNQGATQYQRPFDDTQANTAINGGGAGNVELMLDGVSNEASSTNNTGNARIAYVPPVDSVQEFKIVTNAYDSRFGRNSGGVEDVILKSGTNRIHGDVYEYARRTFLDANLWQNNYKIATALPGTDTSQFGTQKHKLDQYGFELDGPIVIPKVYNGRDKSFFTMQYENWNEVEPNTVTDSVPSPSWLKGDFSNLVYYTGSAYAPISLLDPENVAQNGNGTYVRVPFGPSDGINPTPAANIIPTSRINTVVKKYFLIIPRPTHKQQPAPILSQTTIRLLLLIPTVTAMCSENGMRTSHLKIVSASTTDIGSESKVEAMSALIMRRITVNCLTGNVVIPSLLKRLTLLAPTCCWTFAATYPSELTTRLVGRALIPQHWGYLQQMWLVWAPQPQPSFPTFRLVNSPPLAQTIIHKRSATLSSCFRR